MIDRWYGKCLFFYHLSTFNYNTDVGFKRSKNSILENIIEIIIIYNIVRTKQWATKHY